MHSRTRCEKFVATDVDVAKMWLGNVCGGKRDMLVKPLPTVLQTNAHVLDHIWQSAIIEN